MSEWVSVKDKLPRLGQSVLGWIPFNTVLRRKTPDDVRIVCAWGRGDRIEWQPGYNVCNGLDVTHWMPLPAPPGAEGGFQRASTFV